MPNESREGVVISVSVISTIHACFCLQYNVWVCASVTVVSIGLTAESGINARELSRSS